MTTNPHAACLKLMSGVPYYASRKYDLIDAAAEIERLETLLTSADESNGTLHKRLLKCEEALTKIANLRDGDSVLFEGGCQRIAKEALKP